MADLETALNDLLADPNAMGQLLSLAGQLGLDSVLSPPEQPQETPPEEDVPPSAPPPIPPEQFGQLGQFLSLFRQGSDPQADALLAALRPYLRPERQEKLDRARELAGLSRAARQAYRLWKEGDLHL